MTDKTKLGYCFRCDGKREVVDWVIISLDNDRDQLRGKCIECNGNVSSMIGKSKKNKEKEKVQVNV